MEKKERKNFIFFALAASGFGISGSDRIFIEFARRWSEAEEVQVYVTKEGLRMCKSQNLFGDYLTIKVIGKEFFLKNFFLMYLYKIYLGIKLGLSVNITEQTYIYSASDFWMDVIPAFLIKLRFRKTNWVAAWYQTAPNPIVGYSLGEREKVYRFSAFLYWLSQLFVKPVISFFANLVLVNNFEEKKQFIDLNKKGRVGVVLGAVNVVGIKKWISGHKTENKIYDAVFQGRFHSQKGVVELIDIWKLVVNEMPKAVLAMIGDGPLMKDVNIRIYKLGLDKNVKIFGYIFDGSLKYRIFSRSKIVVHPSFYDSGGMAAAEAMAFGLPGVGFNLKSYKSYYPEGMLKVDIGNLYEFANAILRLLNNKKYNKKLGQEASKMIETSWSWDLRSKEIFEFIVNER